MVIAPASAWGDGVRWLGVGPPSGVADGDPRGAALLEVVRATAVRTTGSDELAGRLLAADLVGAIDDRAALVLGPVPVARGQRVLQLGAGTGSLTRALVDAGAEVEALVADPAQARVAAARVAGCPAVTISCGDIRGWLAATPRDGGVDLIIGNVAAWPTHAPDAIGSTELLAAVVERLAPGGRLVLLAEAPLGLRHVMGPAPLAEVGVTPGPLAGRERLDRALAALGFGDRRWAAMLGDGAVPATIAADGAFSDPAVAAALPLLARVGGWAPPPEVRAVAPDDALTWAIAAGLGASLADRALVIATRGAPTVDGASGAAPAMTAEPIAWVAGDPSRAAGWRCTQEIRAGGDVPPRLVPVAAGDAWSGPIAWRPRAATLPAGIRGDALVTGVLVREGVAAATPLLRAWAAALLDAAARSDSRDEDGRELEVGPAWWAVSPDGAWQAIRSGLRGRFPIPPEVLAHRSLVRLLIDRVLPTGVPADLDGALEVAEAASRLLDAAGLPASPATTAMSLDLEVELRWRTGLPVGDRGAARSAARREHRMHLAAARGGASLAWLLEIAGRRDRDEGPAS